MCGTNDLRSENKPDIAALSESMIEKVKQLRGLCPFTKVILMPVLPTRIRAMNNNIMAFNRLVGRWVNSQADKYIVNPFVHEFLDTGDLLGRKWVREGDDIHLGAAGLCKFISIIKNNIYLREKLLREPNAQRKTPNSGRPGSKPA